MVDDTPAAAAMDKVFFPPRCVWGDANLTFFQALQKCTDFLGRVYECDVTYEKRAYCVVWHGDGCRFPCDLRACV